MESPKAAMEAGGGGEVGGGAVGTGCAAVNAASTTNGRIRKRATFGTATSFADRRCIPGTRPCQPGRPVQTDAMPAFLPGSMPACRQNRCRGRRQRAPKWLNRSLLGFAITYLPHMRSLFPKPGTNRAIKSRPWTTREADGMPQCHRCGQAVGEFYRRLYSEDQERVAKRRQLTDPPHEAPTILILKSLINSGKKA